MIRFPGNQNKTPVTFPAVMSKSRDWNMVENLLTVVFNYFYILSSEIRNCHNPKRCDVNLLPLLAEYYRYQYTDVESVALEREIIGSVPVLHHEKGTVTGIENALALSKVNKTDDITIPWFYVKETNQVIVILFDGLKTYKLRELLSLVVPLGTRIVMKPGHSIKASEEVKMHSWTEINCGELDYNKQYYVQPNNYWHVVWDEDKELYHTYIDAQWALGNPNNKTPHAQYTNPITKESITDDGASRVGGMEIASNDTKVPDSEGE